MVDGKFASAPFKFRGEESLPSFKVFFPVNLPLFTKQIEKKKMFYIVQYDIHSLNVYLFLECLISFWHFHPLLHRFTCSSLSSPSPPPPQPTSPPSPKTLATQCTNNISFYCLLNNKQNEVIL